MSTPTPTTAVSTDVAEAFRTMRDQFDRPAGHPVRRIAAQVLRPLLVR